MVGATLVAPDACGAKLALSASVTKQARKLNRRSPRPALNCLRRQPPKETIMEKTKSKAKRFLKLDRLGLRIAHAQKYFAKRRKERAERAFERSLLQTT